MGVTSLAASVLRGRLAPWALSLVHAVMGALGLVLTFATVFQGAAFPVRVGFVVLIVAALGGFYLASFHLRGRVGPKPVVVIHALAAVTGVAIVAGVSLGLV